MGWTLQSGCLALFFYEMQCSFFFLLEQKERKKQKFHPFFLFGFCLTERLHLSLLHLSDREGIFIVFFPIHVFLLTISFSPPS